MNMKAIAQKFVGHIIIDDKCLTFKSPSAMFNQMLNSKWSNLITVVIYAPAGKILYYRSGVSNMFASMRDILHTVYGIDGYTPYVYDHGFQLLDKNENGIKVTFTDGNTDWTVDADDTVPIEICQFLLK